MFIGAQAVENPLNGQAGGAPVPFGFEVVALATAAGDYVDSGSWAVTPI